MLMDEESLFKKSVVNIYIYILGVWFPNPCNGRLKSYISYF